LRLETEHRSINAAFKAPTWEATENFQQAVTCHGSCVRTLFTPIPTVKRLLAMITLRYLTALGTRRSNA